MTFDVIVVGAGIVGAACARALAEHGARVAVLEERRPGAGATAAGMGHLVVMDDSPAQLALTRRSLELWRELASELDERAEWRPCGTIWVCKDAAELEEAARRRATYLEHGVEAELLDERALREAEPNLRPGLAGALRVPGDSVIYPPAVTSWLLARACAHGAELRVGARVTRIEPGDDRTPPHAVLAEGGFVQARHIVDAAGVAATDLLAGSALAGVVRPRKGHLIITDRLPAFCRHQILEAGYLQSAHGHAEVSVAFNLQPRRTGQLLLGSSRQFGREGAEVEGGVLAAMVERALEFAPALAGAPVIRAWTGFRAATPDSLPLIGPLPGAENVILACGHEGLGITTSLATAELVAARIAQDDPAIPPRPYAPARFADGV